MNKSLKKYWRQIVSLCGLISCSLGICSNSQGVFFKAAAEDLHIMIGTFSMQNTVSYIIMSFCAMYVVRLTGKVKYRRLLLVGSVLTGMSFIVVGFTSNMIVFYILGILRGIGASTFAVAIVTIGIHNWFMEKTGKNARQIFDLIKYLVREAGVKAKEEDWNSYDVMNKKIEDYLDGRVRVG